MDADQKRVAELEALFDANSGGMPHDSQTPELPTAFPRVSGSS